MKFVNRLAYYLGGFSIGIIILLFFLNGKEASCDYGPNARTVKNIASKPISYSNEASQFLNEHNIDATTVINLIKYGNVDFSKSNIEKDSCKIYIIENTYKERPYTLTLMNCDTTAELKKIKNK